MRRRFAFHLQPPLHVVAVAVGAVHGSASAQAVARRVGVILRQEIRAVSGIVDFEDADRSRPHPRHIVALVRVRPHPIVVFPFVTGEIVFGERVSPLRAVAPHAIGNVHRVRAEEADLSAACRDGFLGIGVIQRDARHLERLKVGFLNGAVRATLQHAVVEGRHRQAQRIPGMAGGQYQRNVGQSAVARLGEDDVAAILVGVCREAHHRRTGGTMIHLHRDLLAHMEPVRFRAPLGQGAFQVSIDIQVGPDVVGYVVVGIVLVTIAVHVFGHPPVGHLVAFRVGIVVRSIPQRDPVFG